MANQLLQSSSFDILDALAQRILILDGAMGTMVQRFRLQEEDYRGDRFRGHPTSLKNNNDVLNLTQPQIIEQIHREYLAAGADIIETNTFNATAISQEDFGLQKLVAGMNRTAAQLAKSAVAECMTEDPSRPRYAAVRLGPLYRPLSVSPDFTNPGKRNVTSHNV